MTKAFQFFAHLSLSPSDIVSLATRGILPFNLKLDGDEGLKNVSIRSLEWYPQNKWNDFVAEAEGYILSVDPNATFSHLKKEVSRQEIRNSWGEI